ncbi:ImuA family protein [Rhizobium paknamense]|uniref:Protein ImuA n=1 Tax=Rhizobium paknamense TaxID=1206817 RepID=A0ABU0II76_9HYPH|nr:hypothetical protein [Rhizobium paknamense]MDQ0457934.1 protein ImuA [Rhizobium paknamense]
MSSSAHVREELSALRNTIAAIEAGAPLSARSKRVAQGWNAARDPENDALQTVLPFHIEALDHALKGGLCLAGMTEIRHAETRESGAASGFVLGLAARLQALRPGQPVLWIAQSSALQEAGLPYGLGLACHGVQPERFLLARLPKLIDALWLAETALAHGCFTAVILEVRGNPAAFGLKEGRRLQLRAKAQGLPFLLLRQAGDAETGAAHYRLLVRSAPAGFRLLPDGQAMGMSLGNPVFRVTVEKSSTALSCETLLEWSPNDHEFRLCEPDRFAARNEPGAPHSVDRLSASALGPDHPARPAEIIGFKRTG